MADQVARAALTLRALEPFEKAPVRCQLSQHPDAIAACLAILAAGRGVDLEVVGPALEGERADGDPAWLPACRGALESFPHTSLELQTASPEIRLPGGGWSQVDLQRSVERFEEVAAAPGGSASRSAIRPASRDARLRPILYAGPQVALEVLVTLLGWSVRSQAAWALEDQTDAFTATALWTRPSHLVATAEELNGFAAAFDRAAMRHSRLRCVVVTSGELDPSVESRLGLAATRWPAIR